MTHDDPANRFGELPERTRAFLSRLDDNEVETLEAFVQNLSAFGRVGKLGMWLAVIVSGTIIGAITLWQLIEWAFARLTGR